MKNVVIAAVEKFRSYEYRKHSKIKSILDARCSEIGFDNSIIIIIVVIVIITRETSFQNAL